ncbi:MAG: hypothetical protein ACNI25_07500 [Halarcobacter sp.]
MEFESLISKVVLALIIGFLGVLIYFLIKTICDKKTSDYFNANIKDKLSSMFDGYRNEILEHLNDIKNIKDFRESKILICNDNKNKINNMAIFSKFRNMKNINNCNEKIKLNNFSIIILFAEDDKTLEEWFKLLKSVDENIPILIYTNGNVGLEKIKLFENKIHSPINNQFTLIERLHSAYLIKKVLDT